MSQVIEKAWLTTIKEMAKAPKTMKQEGFENRLINFLARQEKANLKKLWLSFTQERAEIRKGMMSTPADVVAYLLGFHLPNAYRMVELSRRVKQRYDLQSYFDQAKKVQIIDIACGTGALSQGFLAAHNIPNERLGLRLHDIKKRLLSCASSIHAAVSGAKTLNCPIEALRFTELAGKDETLVMLLGYVWNELDKNPRAQRQLINGLVISVQKESLVYVLEPANKGLAFSAMELRELMLEIGYLPLYPCPHSQSCPMLPDRKDYCYSEFFWDQPKLMGPIDKELQVSRRVLACAAYVFASPSLHAKLKASAAVPNVVVGMPRRLEDKAISDFILCTEQGELTKVPAKVKRMRGLSLDL